MITREITITNKSGMHARPSAQLVQVAFQFKSDISVEYNGSRVNGKSIMGLESLGITHGCRIKIYTEGEDEQEAMEAVIDIIENINKGDDQWLYQNIS